MAAEKILSLALTLLLVAALPLGTLMRFTFLVGHAHILMAWFYRYRSAPDKGHQLAQMAAILGTVFTSYYFLHYEDALYLTLPLYFLYHLLSDEAYLWRYPLNLRQSPIHRGRFLEAAPFFLLYGAQLWDSLPRHQPISRRGLSLLQWFGQPSWMALALPLVVLVVLAYVWVLVRKQHRVDGLSRYFLGLSAGAALLSWGGWQLPYIQLYSFVVLIHVWDWYLHYGIHLRARAVSIFPYLGHIAATNAVAALVLWGAYLSGPWQTACRTCYQETFYYLWTVAHLLQSTRLQDLRQMLGGPSIVSSQSGTTLQECEKP